MMIRVLVVDDSRVVRQLVRAALSGEPGIDVVAEAANGVEAVDQVRLRTPDVVILDVEMPQMDGLEVVRALHVSHPQLPIIMFSTLTKRGAKVTVDALLSGASDYVLKPSGMDGPEAAIKAVRDELVPRIQLLCQRRRKPVGTPRVKVAKADATKPVAPRSSNKSKRSSADIVTIGASTGGPEALASILGSLPAVVRTPLLIAQHMPPMFTSMFAERLDRSIALPVTEVTDGEPLTPGRVYLAPGDQHLEVKRAGDTVVLRTHQSPREEDNRPSATVLFRSAARVFGAKTLAVVLTGMGSDGLLGCQSIHDAGGSIIVQDRESSIVWGMPGSVVRAGLADAVLTPEELGQRLAREAT